MIDQLSAAAADRTIDAPTAIQVDKIGTRTSVRKKPLRLTTRCFPLRDPLAYVLNHAPASGDEFGGKNTEFIDAGLPHAKLEPRKFGID